VGGSVGTSTHLHRAHCKRSFSGAHIGYYEPILQRALLRFWLSGQTCVFVEQNSFLDNMGLDMSSTGGLLGGPMKRLKMLTGAKSSSTLMCYLVGFAVVVFMIIYFMIR